jgi:hypothetical protein
MNKPILLSIGMLGCIIQSASAQTSLFTTTNDFASFGGGSPLLSSDYYSDNSAVNGVGNAANAGGAGGIGSLQLTISGGWGGISSAGVEANQGFLSAFDPGAIAAWSAGSGWGPGTLVAFSGNLSFDVYRANLADWNDFGLILNYNGNWGAFWPSSAADFAGADGRTWTHYEIPYTVNAVGTGLTYFGFELARSAGGNILNQTIYVDNIQVAAVPEPAAMAMLAIGGVALVIFRLRAGC